MKSVLVVEDNPVNLALMEQLMLMKGYEVRSAEDAAAALREIRARLPDLVMMDLQLPGTDGFALTRMLREDPALADLCIVAVSAYAMRTDEERALAAGCDGFVPKPVDLQHLSRVIEDCLARRQAVGLATSATPRQGGA